SRGAVRREHRFPRPRPDRTFCGSRPFSQRQMRTQQGRGWADNWWPQTVECRFGALCEQQVAQRQSRDRKEEGGGGWNESEPRSQRCERQENCNNDYHDGRGGEEGMWAAA